MGTTWILHPDWYDITKNIYDLYSLLYQSSTVCLPFPLSFLGSLTWHLMFFWIRGDLRRHQMFFFQCESLWHLVGFWQNVFSFGFSFLSYLFYLRFYSPQKGKKGIHGGLQLSFRTKLSFRFGGFITMFHGSIYRSLLHTSQSFSGLDGFLHYWWFKLSTYNVTVWLVEIYWHHGHVFIWGFQGDMFNEWLNIF